MKILGIDPGLKATGYGVIQVGDTTRQIQLLETGVVEPSGKATIQQKLDHIYCSLNSLIDQYSPDVMVLEKLFAHYKHPTTACILGHARGVICLLCAQKDILLVEHSVKRIRKAIVGNGNATKIQTRSVVARSLGITYESLTLDASDALALALGYVHLKDRDYANVV